MSTDNSDRSNDLVVKISQVIGTPEPSTSGVRKHGIILLLVGLVATAILVVVSLVGFSPEFCSKLNPRLSSVCLDVGSWISVITCFASFISISVVGFGLVELISASPWNEAKGRRSFIILIITWLLFISVLCLLIDRDFGV
jgi:hypothetical protein